ncbi:ATP-binding protein [Streptosporangium saharense]|uniref:ATP-binding protein n=1 Tax=Streptosporangium saharense TaxID=1706840 RepID=UPI001C879C6E|nr:ATP-binding protein [Streptosporangium saharense]
MELWCYHWAGWTSEVIPINNGHFTWKETPLGEVLLEKTTASAGAARARALDLIGQDHPAKDDVLLIVSELVTNAVVHADRGRTPIRLRLVTTRDLLVVEVHDPGSLFDAPRVTDVQDVCAPAGRGLHLVSIICGGRWGSSLLDDRQGRLVWAALPRTDDAPSAYEIFVARRQRAA